MLCARRRRGIRPRFGSEQQLLEVRLRELFQSPPLLNRDEHGGFHASLGHDLWPFGEAGGEELAESRLGVLDLPDLAHRSSVDIRPD